jgi:anti-sigma B factor antagonist
VDAGVRKTPSGWTVVSFRGELDLAVAPRLREFLLELIDQEGPFLVIDLRAISFLDSAALGTLAGLLRRVAARGGEIRIACLPGPVGKLLEITRLDAVFEVHGSVEDACTGVGVVPD